jgi:hypothetical protein
MTEFTMRRIRNEIIEQCAQHVEAIDNVMEITIEDVAQRIRQMKT